MTNLSQMFPEDIDNMISLPKMPKEQAIITHHHGVVHVHDVIMEKLETPRDKQFKFNPEMRLNK